MLAELETDDAWKALAPPILFGHSSGGLISIHTALRGAQTASAGSRSRRLIWAWQEVPPVKLVAGTLLSRFLPGVSMPTGMTGADCTRSTDIAEAYDRDPMNFKKANVRWFTETAQLKSEPSKRHLDYVRRSTVCKGRATRSVRSPRPSASSTGCPRGPPVPCLPGVYHEVLNEPERATWIDKICPGPC